MLADITPRNGSKPARNNSFAKQYRGRAEFFALPGCPTKIGDHRSTPQHLVVSSAQ